MPRAVGLAKNRLPLCERLPALTVLRTFDAHGFDEIVGRSFQRDAVQRLRHSRFQGDDRCVRVERNMERLGRPRDFRSGRRTFDHVRNFPARAVVEPQILQGGARAVKCIHRQIDFHKSRRRNVKRLRALPVGGPRGGGGGKAGHERDDANQVFCHIHYALHGLRPPSSRRRRIFGRRTTPAWPPRPRQ